MNDRRPQRAGRWSRSSRSSSRWSSWSSSARLRVRSRFPVSARRTHLRFRQHDLCSASSGSTTTALNTAVNVADPRPRRHLARADLLDVRRRAPPHRRPAAGRLRHARVAVPVRRDDRLPDRAAAGVPRRRAPARARDDRPPRRAWPTSTTSSARTATTRSRRDYLRCPSCMRKLKERCYSCGKPIEPTWKICPYCEAETERRRRHAAAGVAARPPARRSRPSQPDEPRRRGAHAREPRHGTDTDPGQARRVRARPDRRDHRALRAQGPADRRAAAHDDDRGHSPSSTTPSTRASRSSASWSSSSPPARWWRWCSRATRRSRRRAR